jgi:predicted aconitase with swiveling domain
MAETIFMEQMEPICMKGAVLSIREGHRGSSTGGYATVDACDSGMAVLEFLFMMLGEKERSSHYGKV